MKNLYPKSKGKIYPSPSSSSSSSSSPTAAASSSSSTFSTSHVLNLLPAAILALISVLGFDDREVLAYLILRSMKTPSLMLEEKKKCKKLPNAETHRPLLDCPCFDCYTSFWIRWDSSPNRELIHQAIEAFEEHLAKGETNPKKGRKKDRRVSHKDKRNPHKLGFVEPPAAAAAAAADATPASGADTVSPHETTTRSSEKKDYDDHDDDDEGEAAGEDVGSPGRETLTPPENVSSGPPPQLPGGNHRGLVRKVWPDVMGMFNSRLWGLWNPNA